MTGRTTIERSRAKRKAERLQAHWVVPGHVARVYNIVGKSAYTVTLRAGFWTCECTWSKYGSGPCKHLTAVVDKVRREAQR